MSMHSDIDWSQGEDNFKKVCFEHRLPKGHWSLLGPGTEEQWYGSHTHQTEGRWNRSSEMMMLTLGESGHPVFRATSALDRGFL